MEAFPILARYQQELGYRLDAVAINRLERLRDLLLAWNTRFNLTRVTDPLEVETRLYLDALAMLPLIRATRGAGESAQPVKLIDVGAGAGFPGLPLKILAPEIELVLIEATAKKVVFLDEAIQALGLSDTLAVHGRAEELAHDARFRSRFDVVTARAVAHLPALVEMCMPFCRVGGRGIFPKGRDLDQELASASKALHMLRCQLLRADTSRITELDRTTFVLVQQVSKPPATFPRRPGIPTKDPL